MHIDAFRKVFQQKKGITISTNHGVKGAEFDTVIAFGLLDGYVPHFSESNKEESAKRILYVIASRARKNLYLGTFIKYYKISQLIHTQSIAN